MEGFHERLRWAREAHGLRQEDVAAWFGIRRESVADWESGKTRPDGRRIPTLLANLHLTYEWLVENKGPRPLFEFEFGGNDQHQKTVLTPGRTKGEKPVLVQLEGASQRARRRHIPIHAAAMGGKGHLIIDWHQIDSADVPELANVRDAYGILIVGESMVPAFRPGDIAWVNPHKLPERDTEVVLYRVAPHGAEAEAIVKTLVTFTDRTWKLRQYSPARDWSEDRSEWQTCHRIIGKRNAK